MKKLLLFPLLLFAASFSFGQDCQYKGSFTNSTDISTSGTVEIVINKKGKTQLVFANDFNTESGPDLDVYFSKAEKVDANNSVRLESLYALNGPLKYTVDKSINLSDYSYVVIHCTQYNHWYGTAKLEKCQD